MNRPHRSEVRPGTKEWLDQVKEEILDPSRRIVDSHHHLWPVGGAFPYTADDLVQDTESGHNIVATVFVECHAAYRRDGPTEHRSLGETHFVASEAQVLQNRFPDAAPIAGIVAHIDLTLGERLDSTLALHREASNGLLCGVRDALASALEPKALHIAGRFPPDKSTDPALRNGIVELGRHGLVYESWHYHHQADAFVELARSAPETTFVLDHFATPLGVGMYKDKRDEVYAEWAAGITAAASCPNVVAKLGGLAMPDNGFGWDKAERPPTSDEFVEAQARYFHHTIESFGPQRCMFESNFPVDRYSLSYPVLWNALKKIAARYTDEEQDAMFELTARRVYKL